MVHTVASDVIVYTTGGERLTPEERKHMRFEQIERFLHSEMTATQWAKLNHMHESTFYLWLARYRSEHPTDASPKPLQKKKQTTEWIALSKQDIADQTAIVVSDTANVETERPLADVCDNDENGDAVEQFPFIGVQLNGASVTIPAGTAKTDIENVIQAVSKL